MILITSKQYRLVLATRSLTVMTLQLPQDQTGPYPLMERARTVQFNIILSETVSPYHKDES
jgi:hypothetical protein